MGSTFIMNLNPFSEFSKFNINARTLRTSWFRKIMDSISVIAGGPFSTPDFEKVHVGIFDYLTLFSFVGFHYISYVLSQLTTTHLGRSDKMPIRLLGYALIAVLAVINLSLITIRYTASSLLALASAFTVTLTVHLIASILSSEDKALIATLQATPEADREITVINNVYDLLSDYDEHGGKFLIYPLEKLPNDLLPEDPAFLEQYKDTDDTEVLCFTGRYWEEHNMHCQMGFRFFKFDRHSQQRPLEALRRLNIGHIAEHELEERQQDVEQGPSWALQLFV
jgi:hypothetical protein